MDVPAYACERAIASARLVGGSASPGADMGADLGADLGAEIPELPAGEEEIEVGDEEEIEEPSSLETTLGRGKR